MTAKEYLKQYQRAQSEKDALYEQIEVLRREAMRIKTPMLDEHISGGIPRTMEDVVAEMVDLRQYLFAKIRQCLALQKEIAVVIDSLDDARYVDLLKRRYILGHTWERIAYEMGYHWRSVYKIHGQALKEIEKKRAVKGSI